MIQDIKALLSVADVRSISFFPLNCNKVADHEIARWAVSCRAYVFWESSFPPWPSKLMDVFSRSFFE